MNKHSLVFGKIESLLSRTSLFVIVETWIAHCTESDTLMKQQIIISSGNGSIGLLDNVSMCLVIKNGIIANSKD